MRAGRQKRRRALALRVVLASIAAIVAVSDVSAHRQDEYLQAARIAVEPGRVQLALDLTPGIAVADAIIADVDRDRDGSLSAHEKQVYVDSVLGAIELEIDGRARRMTLLTFSCPDLDALRQGEAAIHVESAVVVARQSNGAHQLVYRNMHRRDLSVYLANALAPPSDQIAVAAQRRDAAQHDLTIDYVVQGQTDASTSAWLGGIIAAMCVAILRRRKQAF